MYKILISGYYGFNNIGDDAILRTVTENLQEKVGGVEITVLSHDPRDTEEKYGIRAVKRMSVFGILREILRCDMLISGGGSLLQDVTGRFSILYYLAIIRMAILFGKKVFIYSQGIGPITRPLNRRLTADCLRRADMIAVRDERSARFLRQIGVPEEKVTITADPVLRLRPAELDRGSAILREVGAVPAEGRKLVGWAIRGRDLNPRFLDEIEASIRWLQKERNADSVLIPFHYDEDKKAIEVLRERLGDEVSAVTDKHLSDEMLSIIGNLDLLVGVRLHSLIYAAVMDVPMIGISYDPKIDAFLDSVGLSAVSDTKAFDRERFREAYDTAQEEREARDATVRERVRDLTKKLDTNDELIKGMIEEKKPEKEKNKRGVSSVIGNVMIITVISKVLGIFRESVQANVFGSADDYYAAFNKTIYLFMTAAYAMCVAAVPIMTKAFGESREKGEKTANNLISVSLAFGLVVLAGWEALSFIPGLWSNGAGQELLFIRIMLLSLPIIIAAYLMVALYQSLDHFVLQGSMAIPYSILLVGYLVLLGKKLSLTAYVVMVAAAWLSQLAMSFPYARRENYHYKPVLLLRESYVPAFARTCVVTVVTTSMYLFCYLIDAARAERLGEGVTSAFYYADRLFTPLTTTFIYSISAVMFPRLNREYTKANKRDYLGYVWGITSNTMVIVFPVCALLIVFGSDILKVLFESGNFTPEATKLTGRIFVMYALGMAGFSALDLLNKAFFAMEKALVPFLISLGVIAANFLLDALFGLSAAMLAVTTAGTVTLGAVATVLVLFRGERVVDLRDMGKSILASALMGGAAWGLRLLLVNGTEGKILLVIKCGLIGVATLAVFFGAAWLMKLETLTGAVKAKLGKK